MWPSEAEVKSFEESCNNTPYPFFALAGKRTQDLKRLNNIQHGLQLQLLSTGKQMHLQK